MPDTRQCKHNSSFLLSWIMEPIVGLVRITFLCTFCGITQLVEWSKRNKPITEGLPVEGQVPAWQWEEGD